MSIVFLREENKKINNKLTYNNELFFASKILKWGHQDTAVSVLIAVSKARGRR